MDRSKIELPHEQMMRQYGINNDQLIDLLKTNSGKNIPGEWLKEMILICCEMCIKVNGFKIEEMRHPNNSKEIVIIFENDQDIPKFESEFNSQFVKVVNSYIQEKGENPKNYHRAISLISASEKNVFRFEY